MTSYQDLLNERRAWYKDVGSVYCPCLKTDIVFNSKGFHHLRYDGFGKARSVKECTYRLGLLPLVIPVIKNAKSVYKYTPPDYVKSADKFVEYWALRETVGKQSARVTVILRKVGTGNITFHSVMKQNDRKTKKPSRKS
ncbi:MAG: hypothetical protein NUV80_03025 [Candidatus Berkelbacteria bacterium]|nr:hypothetical protein [Candidatus Berkelbacteria bacterium]MCR4307507.1 hypothetical protein [Candidatus Berkelbacteria bacterium]